MALRLKSGNSLDKTTPKGPAAHKKTPQSIATGEFFLCAANESDAIARLWGGVVLDHASTTLAVITRLNFLLVINKLVVFFVEFSFHLVIEFKAINIHVFT